MQWGAGAIGHAEWTGAPLSAVLEKAGLRANAVEVLFEGADRGIPPIDSASTFEVTGIKVDVLAANGEKAREEGWREAQQKGWKALWAKTNQRPVSEAPTLSDSTLDNLVSSIVVEREQIGPNRYIATLGVLFDRTRAGELLGFAGQVRRSAPMLLIHGNPFTHLSWHKFAPRLAKEFTVVAIDLRGYGYSSKPPGGEKPESAPTGKLKVIGDLTIRGITKRVELDLTGPTAPVDDGSGHLHMGVAASATIDRTDFGMSGYQGMVGNSVALTIDAELVQTSAGAANKP